MTNAIGNLELKNEYAQALSKVGHDLENVAEQVRRDHFFYEILQYLHNILGIVLRRSFIQESLGMN